MISIRLPVPPSVNALYFNRYGKGFGKGRGKTAKYRAWLSEADRWLMVQKYPGLIGTITGPCELVIKLPKIRGDASNRVKSCEDFLVSREITGDDKHNRKVSVEIDESLVATEGCLVLVTPL